MSRPVHFAESTSSPLSPTRKRLGTPGSPAAGAAAARSPPPGSPLAGASSSIPGFQSVTVLRDQANDHFHNKRYKEAAQAYTAAIQKLYEIRSSLSKASPAPPPKTVLEFVRAEVQLLTSRAACASYRNDHKATIRDASAVVDSCLSRVRAPSWATACPPNLMTYLQKALLKRSHAFEAIGNHAFALEDLNFVINSSADTRTLPHTEIGRMRKLMRPAFPGTFNKPENFEDKKWRRLVRFLPGFTKVEAKNDDVAPCPRSSHTLTRGGTSDSIYIMGGQDLTAKPSDPSSTPSSRTPDAFADLYQFSPSSQLWRRISAVYTDGSKVGVLSGHSAVVYQNAIYFFGSNAPPASGSGDAAGPPSLPIEQPENTRVLGAGELVKFDIEKETFEVIKGQGARLPKPSRGHAAVVVDDSMYVFGADGVEGIVGSRSNSLWEFEFRTGTWKCLCEATSRNARVCGANQPEARSGAGFWPCVDESARRLMLFGGSTDDESEEKKQLVGHATDFSLGDQWFWDVDMERWYRVRLAGNAPAARGEMGAVSLASADGMMPMQGGLLFGGHTTKLWSAFDSNCCAWFFVVFSFLIAFSASTFLGECFQWMPKMLMWRMLRLENSSLTARSGHAMCLGPIEDDFQLVYAFGGFDKSHWLNDLHVLRIPVVFDEDVVQETRKRGLTHSMN